MCELGSGKKAKPLPVLDFDDLLHMPVRQGLSLDPGPPRRLGRLRRLDGPLRWVLADETQDNSRIRQLMLQRLVAESGCRIFVVGDDMQDCTTE